MNKNLTTNDSQEETINLDRNTHVNLFVNRSPLDSEIEIDLSRVFHNMKCKWKSFLCMLLLFAAIGVSIPLIIYQFTSEPLTVSSIVTLNYKVPVSSADGSTNYVPVNDLTAPDGSELDLNQITSSYVLRNALENVKLSKEILLEDIPSSITIEKILTDQSLQQQEIASNKMEAKTADAYEAVQELQTQYMNKFEVSLQNCFGEKKEELKDSELRGLLDAILLSYNDYLLERYNALHLPDDEISAIRVDNLDIMECLDQLSESVRHLYDYCDSLDADIKTYRSYRTGLSLVDLMEDMTTVQEVNIDYLYAYVKANKIVRDKDAMQTYYQSRILAEQAELDMINDNISSLDTIIKNYKNDQIYITIQESDAAKSTTATTEYYNELILQQANNYAQAADIEIIIAQLENVIMNLEADIPAEKAVSISIESVEGELDTAITVSHAMYESIYKHMQEVVEQPIYRNFTEHSAALGQTENYLVASKKNLIIGVVVAALAAFGVWFLRGLAPELSRRGQQERNYDSYKGNTYYSTITSGDSMLNSEKLSKNVHDAEKAKTDESVTELADHSNTRTKNLKEEAGV